MNKKMSIEALPSTIVQVNYYIYLNCIPLDSTSNITDYCLFYIFYLICEIFS